MNQLLFANDTALVSDSQERLTQLVKEFWRLCERRKIKVNVSRNKVMRCTRMVDDRMMNVALNGKLLEDVKCFEYLASHIAIDGKMNEEVKFIMNEVGKMCGGMKKLF